MDQYLAALSVIIGLFSAGIVYLFNAGSIYSGDGISTWVNILALGVTIVMTVVVYRFCKKFFIDRLFFTLATKRGPIFLLLVIGFGLAVLWFAFLCMILMGIGSLIAPLLMALCGIPDLIWKGGSSGKSAGRGLSLAGLGLFLIGIFTTNITPLTLASFRPPDPLVVKIDMAYYNVYRLGLRGYTCEEHCDMVDHLKKELMKKYGKKAPGLSSLDSLRFKVTFDPKTAFVCEPIGYKPPAGAPFEKEVEQEIDDIRTMTLRYVGSWGDFSIGVLLRPKSVSDVQKGNEGWVVSCKEKNGTLSTIQFDTQLKMMLFLTPVDPKMSLAILPIFTGTPDGFLLKSMKYQVNDLPDPLNEEFEYQTIEGFQLPKRIVLTKQNGTIGETNLSEISFDFSNYQVTKDGN